MLDSEKTREIIQSVASEAARIHGVSAAPLERFLASGAETWDDVASGMWTIAGLRCGSANLDAASFALRNLLQRIAGHLPDAVRTAPMFASEVIGERLSPMVRGLVQRDWQDLALQELTRRTFVLNLPGTQAALEAELSTGFLSTAWQVVWTFFADCGLKVPDERLDIDGVSAGEYAHVRASALSTDDPYCDVVVHEGAHLLHYLKPARYGLYVRRGQERFVDVEFRKRELFAFACEAYSRVARKGSRKARILSAERMEADAKSFPSDEIAAIAALVGAAAQARNGWRVIRDGVVARPKRGRMPGLHSRLRSADTSAPLAENSNA
jgi:hypothetical protein